MQNGSKIAGSNSSLAVVNGTWRSEHELVKTMFFSWDLLKNLAKLFSLVVYDVCTLTNTTTWVLSAGKPPLTSSSFPYLQRSQDRSSTAFDRSAWTSENVTEVCLKQDFKTFLVSKACCRGSRERALQLSSLWQSSFIELNWYRLLIQPNLAKTVMATTKLSTKSSAFTFFKSDNWRKWTVLQGQDSVKTKFFASWNSSKIFDQPILLECLFQIYGTM